MSNTDSSFKEYSAKVILTIGEKLYLNEEMADFHFVIELADGRCERIPAHKNFLATASDVFRAMFNGDWIEANEVKIIDASPNALHEFLQFIYLGQVKVTAANVAQVMNMGKKYDIPECVSACKDFLMSTLTSDTVCSVYGLAILLDEMDLVAFCEEIIRTHASKVFSSVSFLKCDRKVLSHILKLDSLYCTAAKISDACVSWLKSTSQEEHLTREIAHKHLDSFYDIPFGLMSLKEFITFDDLNKGLLTLDEYRDIIHIIESTDYQPEIFSANRKILFGYGLEWNQDVAILCDQSVDYHEYGPYFVQNIETTTFSTNEAILLGAIICEDLSVYRYNEYNSSKEVPTKIAIIKINESGERVIVHKGEAHLNGRTDTRIPLPNPILIQPGSVYEIQMEQQPPVGCCTSNRIKSGVKIDGITITFYNSVEEAYGEMRVDSDDIIDGLVTKLEFNLIHHDTSIFDEFLFREVL